MLTHFDYTEIIALGIVGIALFVYIRSLITKKKSDACCKKNCDLKAPAKMSEKELKKS